MVGLIVVGCGPPGEQPIREYPGLEEERVNFLFLLSRFPTLTLPPQTLSLRLILTAPPLTVCVSLRGGHGVVVAGVGVVVASPSLGVVGERREGGEGGEDGEGGDEVVVGSCVEMYKVVGL